MQIRINLDEIPKIIGQLSIGGHISLDSAKDTITGYIASIKRSSVRITEEPVERGFLANILGIDISKGKKYDLRKFVSYEIH